MVMDAKTAILARAREAIERSQEGRPVREIPRNYIREGQHAPGSDEVVAEMIEKLEDYSAQVVEARDDQQSKMRLQSSFPRRKLLRLSFPPASMISSRRRLDAISERYARIRGRTLFRHWNWMESMQS